MDEVQVVNILSSSLRSIRKFRKNYGFWISKIFATRARTGLDFQAVRLSKPRYFERII